MASPSSRHRDGKVVLDHRNIMAFFTAAHQSTRREMLASTAAAARRCCRAEVVAFHIHGRGDDPARPSVHGRRHRAGQGDRRPAVRPRLRPARRREAGRRCRRRLVRDPQRRLRTLPHEARRRPPAPSPFACMLSLPCTSTTPRSPTSKPSNCSKSTRPRARSATSAFQEKTVRPRGRCREGSRCKDATADHAHRHRPGEGREGRVEPPLPR